jgi:hypothetical protein
MTLLVLVAIAALFAINLTQIFEGDSPAQNYLKFNHVRGMAVRHKQLLYTLNFDQQNDVIQFLNRSVRLEAIKTEGQIKPEIDKIIVYLFEEPSKIEITPIAYIDRNLIYSAPQWGEGYFMDVSDGQLQHLLSQTYDR